MSLLAGLQQLLLGSQGAGVPATGTTPAVAPTQVVPPTPASSNLAGLLSGQTGLTPMLRSIGGGMANMGNSGGDPYLAFAQGFGGATNYSATRDANAVAAQAAAAKAQQDHEMEVMKFNQEQNNFDAKFGQENAHFDAKLGIDKQQLDINQAARARADLLAQSSVKKTAAEIDKMSKATGTPVRVITAAQAAADQAVKDAGYKLTTPEDQKAYREQVYAETRDRMMRDLGLDPAPKVNSPADGPGVTGQGSLSDGSAPIPLWSYDANGNLLKNGKLPGQ